MKKTVITLDKDLEDIIPSFLENRRKDLERISSAIKEQSYEPIRTIGHRLNGNAGSYGLPKLGEIGAKLEAASEEENLENIKALLGEYRSYMDQLKIRFE